MERTQREDGFPFTNGDSGVIIASARGVSDVGGGGLVHGVTAQPLECFLFLDRGHRPDANHSSFLPCVLSGALTLILLGLPKLWSARPLARTRRLSIRPSVRRPTLACPGPLQRSRADSHSLSLCPVSLSPSLPHSSCTTTNPPPPPPTPSYGLLSSPRGSCSKAESGRPSASAAAPSPLPRQVWALGL